MRKLVDDTLNLTKNVFSTSLFNLFVLDPFLLLFLSVEDIERNDGSPEKPYYMSDSLKKILDKQNRGSVERVDGASDTEKPIKTDE